MLTTDRVQGVNNRDDTSGLEDTQESDNERCRSVSINGYDVALFKSMIKQKIGQTVCEFLDLKISKRMEAKAKQENEDISCKYRGHNAKEKDNYS